mmetsp:Transcript_20619/g.18771  ORF Transcript_20619/g.18771 Transcript_20619/m.18771 type:complete len:89 (-) Transcript_20619:467-733(-)
MIVLCKQLTSDNNLSPISPSASMSRLETNEDKEISNTVRYDLSSESRRRPCSRAKLARDLLLSTGPMSSHSRISRQSLQTVCRSERFC